MSVDERVPKIAGPTGQVRVGGWERKVDGGWMMSRLRPSWGPSKSKAVGAGVLWVGLELWAREGRKVSQRLAAEAGQCGAG